MSVGEPEAPTNARASLAGDTLQRLVASHGRMSMVGQRGVETVRVRVPRDLEVLDRRRCSIQLKVADNQGATATPGALEDTRHLTEWETFARALLTTHRCIVGLTLDISAVKRAPRHFYQSFSLRNGIAQINVELTTFREPFQDFLLPCISQLCKLRNYQPTGIHLDDISWQARDNLPQDMSLEEILGLGHLQLNDDRLARLLEATADMPFLNVLRICLRNTGARPRYLQDVRLALNRCTSGEHRRLQCEVDADFAHLLDCACANHLDMGKLLTLFTCRELSGLERALATYVLTVTRPIELVSNVLNIIITVCALNEDDR